MIHIGVWLRHVVMLMSASNALVVVCFVEAATPREALCQTHGGASADLSESLMRRTPELVGDKWGWRLTKYKNVMNFFKVDGRVMILLSTDLEATDNVIWDPLTGQRRHLNSREYLQFGEEHRKHLISAALNLGQVLQISDDRTIQAWPAPGVGSPNCAPIFYQFFRVRDASGAVLRSFYVVEKIDHPASRKYHICLPGDGGREIKPKGLIEFDSEWLLFDELADGTLLFTSMDDEGTTILRLDENLRQHTSLDGRVFVLDADDINSRLEALPDLQDPEARYHVFLSAINRLVHTSSH